MSYTITDSRGTKRWYYKDLLHRDGGPAVECFDGPKYWYQYDLLHRDDGPAIEWGQTKRWYCQGKRNRKDGPAVIHSNGFEEWYIDDIRHTKEQFQFIKNREKKLISKYFRKWNFICDQPGKKLFKLRLEMSMKDMNFIN